LGPVATYLHSYRMEQRAYVFALTTVFQVLAVAQIVALALFGVYTCRRLRLSMLSLLPIMAALALGARVPRKVSVRTFDLIVLAVLGASAAKLVLDAIG
jgi:hypothetical protein